MVTIKQLLKLITPPIIPVALAALRKKADTPEIWGGNYKTWEDALAGTNGYDSDIILSKCKNALLQVRNGTAIYERDSVLFDEKQYSWPLLAALENCVRDASLTVLDFGGSLGSTYYQNKDFLNSMAKLTWCIVEQPKFVECGKQLFEDSSLKFYKNVDECTSENRPNVLLLSGVLQYLEHPLQQINDLLKLNIPNIIIDRTSFITTPENRPRLTVQKVPQDIYEASYPCWFFNEDEFLSAFTKYYKLVAQFDSFADPNRLSEDRMALKWKGYFFKLLN